jgi:hypothetical protein
VAEHLYEVGIQKVTTAASVAIAVIVPAALAAGVRLPEIREFGIFNVSGVAAEIGHGTPAVQGVLPNVTATVQALYEGDPVGHTQLVSSWTTTQPTVPAVFNKRYMIPAVVGAGLIFTYGPGEFPVWAGAAAPQVAIWQISTAIVTYDLYLKVAE